MRPGRVAGQQRVRLVQLEGDGQLAARRRLAAVLGSRVPGEELEMVSVDRDVAGRVESRHDGVATPQARFAPLGVGSAVEHDSQDRQRTDPRSIKDCGALVEGRMVPGRRLQLRRGPHALNRRLSRRREGHVDAQPVRLAPRAFLFLSVRGHGAERVLPESGVHLLRRAELLLGARWPGAFQRLLEQHSAGERHGQRHHQGDRKDGFAASTFIHRAHAYNTDGRERQEAGPPLDSDPETAYCSGSIRLIFHYAHTPTGRRQ